MALTAALKAQIAAWYKALQEQIPDFIPRPPQRQMIADVAKTLAGEEGRHLAIEAPTGVGKTLSYLIPGIAIAREEQKTLVVSTANVALQDQIYSKDLPLLRKIIPDLRFTAAFGRGRYVCPRNLTALASTEPSQQDLLAFLDDDLTPNNQAEQKLCATLKQDLDSYRWDGLRDHTDKAIDDGLWSRLSTDKASCLNRNCHYYRECPFFVARREIQEAEVVVANHALVMAAMESEAVLPEPKNLLLVLDEGHHLPDVARDALEMSAEITRDIAAQAGQNIAAITYYFGSKDDLYLACAQWIADFIGDNFRPQAEAAEHLLAGEAPDRQAIRDLILSACHNMILLLTQDDTVNLSKFISREQLAPTAAYHLIHQQVIAPLHHYLTRLIAAWTGCEASDTQMILHTHALLGEVLAFRLGRETILLRTGWTQFDAQKTEQIFEVITCHIDFILHGLSQRSLG